MRELWLLHALDFEMSCFDVLSDTQIHTKLMAQCHQVSVTRLESLAHRSGVKFMADVYLYLSQNWSSCLSAVHVTLKHLNKSSTLCTMRLSTKVVIMVIAFMKLTFVV